LQNGEGNNLSNDIEVMANEPNLVNLVNLIISTALRPSGPERQSIWCAFSKYAAIAFIAVDGLFFQKSPPPGPPKQLQCCPLVSRIKIMWRT